MTLNTKPYKPEFIPLYRNLTIATKTSKRRGFPSHNNSSIDNTTVSKYIRNISTMSVPTAREYLARLNNYKIFLAKKYDGLSIDDLVSKIKEGIHDSYDILSEYSAYLRNYGFSTYTLKERVVTVKNFLEYHDIDISPRMFKLKVKLPKTIRKNKEALSKEDIIDILNACSDIRLKTYVMFLAAGGFRAVEGLSVRIKDLDIESSPVKVFIRGEYTKTKTDRIVFLTDEIAQQLKLWLNYKYRTRRVCYKDERKERGGGKIITEYRTPQKDDNDLIFAVQQSKIKPCPNSLYTNLVRSFAKTLDRMGKGAKEDGNPNRRQITLHSFRRFVKTTISDLGYADYSEYFIGHSVSTYWRKKESEKAELFHKIEPYLTFLNVHQLERQGADIQSKVEELEEVNQSLRQRDKVKDDAITHLSDQLVALSVRLQDIERRQGSGLAAGITA